MNEWIGLRAHLMAFLYHRRVHFADTDAAGWVHFSRLLCYVEEAEHALLAKLNIPLMGDGGWPRVQVQCDYLAPLRCGDEVEVSLTLETLGKSSLVWRFSVTAHGRESAKGSVKTVRVNANGRPEELSPDWRHALSEV